MDFIGGKLILLLLAKAFCFSLIKPKEVSGVSRLPGKILSCSLHPNRIFVTKTITKKNELGEFDIITSRAFATIEKTINLTKTNTHENTKYLLLKGKASHIKKELKDIDKNMFRYEIINQDTTKERNIVLLCKDE